MVRCFMDRAGSEADVDDIDPDSMSDDSLSDDSFHPELSNTTGPVTPPRLAKTDLRTLPSATVINDNGIIFGGGGSDAATLDLQGVGVGKISRQPLGAVPDACGRKNYGNFGGATDAIADVSVERPNWKTG